jgi:hypothetical protein
MSAADEITVHITVTARLDRRRVADLYEALGDAAEFFCGDRVTMRQSEARATSGRRGRPPVSDNIDRCLNCGERLPGEGGTFNRAKAHGWRRRYHGNGNRFVCPGCP